MHAERCNEPDHRMIIVHVDIKYTVRLIRRQTSLRTPILPAEDSSLLADES